MPARKHMSYRDEEQQLVISQVNRLMVSQAPRYAIVHHQHGSARKKKQDGRRIPRRDSWMVLNYDTGDVLGTFPTGRAASKAATVFRITRQIIPKITRILTQK